MFVWVNNPPCGRFAIREPFSAVVLTVLKTKTYDIYRDGKSIAAGISNNKVNDIILKDAGNQRLLDHTPIIYSLHREGKLRKKCRVLNKVIVWLKPPFVEWPKNIHLLAPRLKSVTSTPPPA
jgi:hypothetical protein